ncbi:MAG: YiiG family protein [Rhizobiales bacterium]|nr:YiiG family protein [Hyphomicrobiales bacterium]
MRLSFSPFLATCLAAAGLSLLVAASPARAQSDEADAAIGRKLEAAIACINRLSDRAYDSRARYVDWAGDKAKMKAKPRNVLGLYTIYETDDCAKGVAEAKAVAPAHAELERASEAYVKAVQTLEPMLKDADDYYEQENYKDDKFAKGREMHSALLAAWDSFGKADGDLRAIVGRIGDERQLVELAKVEKQEGRKARYHIMNTFLQAKSLVRLETDVEMSKMDLPKVQDQVAVYEKAVKDLEAFNAGEGDGKIDSFYISSAKEVLVTAKGLMRRVRDKEGFSEGDRMMLSQPGAGWMVDGSQPRLIRDYNQLVDHYNRM